MIQLPPPRDRQQALVLVRNKQMMDIRKWLEETVLPERPPSLPEQRHMPEFLCPKNAEKAPREKRRRKPTSSDSSLLDARPVHKELPPVEEEADSRASISESAYSDAYHHTQSSESSIESQPYARQPRRKTRLERYEPASKHAKERGRQADRHRKGKSDTKRKSRRKKGDKPKISLAQSFHAKNVPKDRLTLKPQDKVGLFNKGRASSPVKGRGLPDLVFSEMKFLQKHKDQPESAPQATSNKKRKKDHAHVQQEEISAYFTTVQPALKEKDTNTRARKTTHQEHPAHQHPNRERVQSIVADSAIPTIEIADKAPFLGFGSRGPRHTSSSYVSWSESIRAPSATPIRAREGSIVNEGQLGSTHAGRHGLSTGASDVGLHPQGARLSVSRHMTNSSGGRFNLSSLEPANRYTSRSHSLPQRKCSPRQEHQADRTGRPKTSDMGATTSLMPPAVPVRGEPNLKDAESVHSPGATSPKKLPDNARQTAHGGYQEEDKVLSPNDIAGADPATSSSMSRLLQECNSAFDQERHQRALSNRLKAAPANVARPSLSNMPHSAIRSLPTVRFSGVETFRPWTPRYNGRGIYEEQALRQEEELLPHINDENLLQETYSMDEPYHEEMNNAEQEWEDIYEDTYPYEPDVEVQLDDFVQPGIRDDGEDTLITDGTGNAVAGGFWRPHKLY